MLGDLRDRLRAVTFKPGGFELSGGHLPGDEDLKGALAQVNAGWLTEEVGKGGGETWEMMHGGGEGSGVGAIQDGGGGGQAGGMEDRDEQRG